MKQTEIKVERPEKDGILRLRLKEALGVYTLHLIHLSDEGEILDVLVEEINIEKTTPEEYFNKAVKFAKATYTITETEQKPNTNDLIKDTENLKTIAYNLTKLLEEVRISEIELKCTKDISNKFYTISKFNNSYTNPSEPYGIKCKYGRIGNAGEVKRYTFKEERTRHAFLVNLITEKLKKGYKTQNQ